ncbi:hypothetical protein E308F_30350 [Moorella sp. E308F]|uniref:hypothetical protein n=1 Tax=Moorella sp. E308F TaxID=2572682 RepID=UPI0010FFBC90|nr:hypothetical protein [Moorella sp. E308F]GEA16789.1 hypothetical protein E308F_30350 [Moorella sp. E308F]
MVNIKLFRDGDMWCALLGEDLMEGVVGFGKTALKALKALVQAIELTGVEIE